MKIIDNILLNNKAIQRVIQIATKTQVDQALSSFKKMSQGTHVFYPKSEIELKEFFAGWSYACVNKRATDFANVENYVEVDGKPEINHPLNQLLKQPNYQYNIIQFKTLLQKWLDFNGNGYIFVEL